MGSQGAAWHRHLWQAGGATFTTPASGGSVVSVQEHADAQAYHVILHQTVDLNFSAAYELCLQGGAAVAGSDLRFAVDGGTALDFATAGGEPRAHLVSTQGGLVSSCFQFTLPPAAEGGTYPGRVALEFGAVVGEMVLCQASLRRCAAPEPAARSSHCIWPPPPLYAFRCPEADLGEELLQDPGLSGSGGSWHTHAWQTGGATFAFGTPGVLVDVNEHADAALYDVQLFQDVELNATGGASYELCVQANATGAGDQLRFAVDGGAARNFTTAGGGLRRTYMGLPKAYLTTSCFRFSLTSSESHYSGRVAVEFGSALGPVALCQASLRRCRAPEMQSPAPVRRCQVAPLQQGGGCERLQELRGPDFGLNSYGQETTGARRCLERLRNASVGDSFTFAAGRCELWRCGTREALFASATGATDGTAVYSELCQYQEPWGGYQGEERRSPVFVQLWDWSFQDVARECEEHLGPNGFDAVQVAPVAEHILGGAWWTKYQPVSFRLDSRSGSRAELQAMVRRCRAAGVEVIVDVILNHIGRPCDAVRRVGDGAGMPCRGWAGSSYGNRRVGGSHGWPLMTPDDFHHLASDRLRNCAVERETYQCPTSTPPNDCSMCDMYGMPDWRTESPRVQEVLWRHLEELHDIGVTMLRVDAASYVHVEDLAHFVNRAPWHYVVQEWWGGVPRQERTDFVGHYRDYHYGTHIVEALTGEASQLPGLLRLTQGSEGIPPEQALGTLTDHDQKTEVSYKSGLEYHQQQKWLLAWPKAFALRLFGGYGWATAEDGPPGCEEQDQYCEPTPVFDEQGRASCMATPMRSPLDMGLIDRRVWVCEHRWEGVAGLIRFRKACRGLHVEQTWVEPERGRLAFRAGDGCFAALQKGYDREARPIVRPGNWDLVGLASGLPEGRYCDLGSVPTFAGWQGDSCPREVLVGPGGVVARGFVPEGDVLALHVGAMLPNATGGGSRDGDDSVILVAGAPQRPNTCAQVLLLLGALLRLA